MDKELNNGCYIKNFILSPSFQEKQPWVMWLTGKLSVIPAHYWTASRFFGGAATIYLYSVGRPILSIIAFILFALTDWVDGKVARHRNEHGGKGAVLDGFADKVFVLPIIWKWGAQYVHPAFIGLLIVIEGSGYVIIPALYKLGLIKREKKEMYEHIMAGKYKFACQVVLVFLLWVASSFGGGGYISTGVIYALLGLIIGLAVLSIAGKINPKWAI